MKKKVLIAFATTVAFIAVFVAQVMLLPLAYGAVRP